MKLDRLPDAWRDELEEMDNEVFSPANSRFAILFTVNALLASGKAIIDTDINSHETRTISRLIIELE